MLNLKNLGSFTYAALDIIFGKLSELEAESHVVKYGHMGIQGVVLEYHCDVSVFRKNIIDQAVPDIDLTLGNVFKAGNHSECC